MVVSGANGYDFFVCAGEKMNGGDKDVGLTDVAKSTSYLSVSLILPEEQRAIPGHIQGLVACVSRTATRVPRVRPISPRAWGPAAGAHTPPPPHRTAPVCAGVWGAVGGRSRGHRAYALDHGLRGGGSAHYTDPLYGRTPTNQRGHC